MDNNNWMHKFVIEKLPQYNSVESMRHLDNGTLQINRKKGTNFTCYCISNEEVNYGMIKEILDKKLEIDFIVNIKKDYLISGSAMSIMNSSHISFGGFGDLIRFSNQRDNQLFVEKEYAFVSRGLEQHDKIKAIERLDNKRIKVERYSLSDVIIVMNNDYDLNTESVRRTKEKFKSFKVILATNPNVRITSDAYSTAEFMDVDICNYREFLGKVNSLWSSRD